jgi:hypothetical protein
MEIREKQHWNHVYWHPLLAAAPAATNMSNLLGRHVPAHCRDSWPVKRETVYKFIIRDGKLELDGEVRLLSQQSHL